VLHTVSHRGQVAAPAALEWFAGDQPDPIGYLLAPGRAEWFRCPDGVAHGPDGPRELGDAFELFATSETRQLRWFHQADGYGQAVCLGEDAALLPPGEPVGAADGPQRTRLPVAAERMLAGRVIRTWDGWATLATARYSSCDVPVAADRDQEVWASLAEYVIRDEHGNVSVADTLLLSLAARGKEDRS